LEKEMNEKLHNYRAKSANLEAYAKEEEQNFNDYIKTFEDIQINIEQAKSAFEQSPMLKNLS